MTALASTMVREGLRGFRCGVTPGSALKTGRGRLRKPLWGFTAVPVGLGGGHPEQRVGNMGLAGSARRTKKGRGGCQYKGGNMGAECDVNKGLKKKSNPGIVRRVAKLRIPNFKRRKNPSWGEWGVPERGGALGKLGMGGSEGKKHWISVKKTLKRQNNPFPHKKPKGGKGRPGGKIPCDSLGASGKCRKEERERKTITLRTKGKPDGGKIPKPKREGAVSVKKAIHTGTIRSPKRSWTRMKRGGSNLPREKKFTGGNKKKVLPGAREPSWGCTEKPFDGKGGRPMDKESSETFYLKKS